VFLLGTVVNTQKPRHGLWHASLLICIASSEVVAGGQVILLICYKVNETAGLGNTLQVCYGYCILTSLTVSYMM